MIKKIRAISPHGHTVEIEALVTSKGVQEGLSLERYGPNAAFIDVRDQGTERDEEGFYGLRASIPTSWVIQIGRDENDPR